jgi:WD40 repeat protein
MLAVAGGTPAESGVAEIWLWPERKRLGTIAGHDDLAYECVWLSGDKLLATASADRSVRIWDVVSGAETARLAGHSGPVLALALSPDGKLLCSGSADQTIRVWDTATWQLVRAMTNHLGPVHGVAFREPARADGESRPPYLASAGGDGTVRIWQPEIGRMVRIVRHPAPVHCIAWDSTGRLFSGSKDGRVREIDADDGSILREEAASNGWLMSLAVTRGQSRDGRSILVGDSLGAIHTHPR